MLCDGNQITQPTVVKDFSMMRFNLTGISIKAANVIFFIWATLWISVDAGFCAENHRFMYVNSIKAPVCEKPFMNSKKIVELEAGSKLVVLEEKGYWYRIACKGYSGWVFKLMVGSAPPEMFRQINTDQLEALESTARRRPSAYATTAAARGLMEKKRKFAARYATDYSAVERMEAGRIGYEEANQFVKEGIMHETME